MDFTTILGAGGLVGLVVVGIFTGALPRFFLNAHGLGIVFGGTLGAMLINTPWKDLSRAASALGTLLRGERYQAPEAVVTAIAALAEQYQSRGSAAFRDADLRVWAGGYLSHAVEVAVEYNNPELVEKILETEINTGFDRDNEIANVYRTMGLLAPMFGLLGTLIGIVSVLQDIASPDKVGGAMAIAMTTAFYGISFANAFCVPVAGKLRLRTIEEIKVKTLVAEGVVMMLRGTVPAVVERTLKAYL